MMNLAILVITGILLGMQIKEIKPDNGQADEEMRSMIESVIATQLSSSDSNQAESNLNSADTAPSTSQIPQTPTPHPIATSWKTSPIDGMNLLYIPGGDFTMGNNENEKIMIPEHNVMLDAYWMDQTEVTNRQFALFLNEMGNQVEGGVTWLDTEEEKKIIQQNSDGEWEVLDGYADHPVIEVTWYAASAYCAWAGRRLPSEAEWEFAARGTDGHLRPWGEDISCDLAQYKECDGETVPVASFVYSASPFGLYDMVGNVWEWTNDWYDEKYYEQSPETNPAGPETGESKVLRGGSWYNDAEYITVTYRRGKEPHVTSNATGFRCASNSR